MTAFITHTILRARPSPDDEEHLGRIDEAAALHLVGAFPFAEELAKRREVPELTVPTLTFRRSADNCYFVVWSETVGEFVLYCPTHEWLVERVTDMKDVYQCLRLFFSGDDGTMGKTFASLVRKYAFDSSTSVILPSHRNPNTSLPPE